MTLEKLQRENEELQARLLETEETLSAIRNGDVDAIIVRGKDGDKVFSIQSSETPYRIIIEEMDEGAVTVNMNGTILYSNHRFSEMAETPLEQVTGSDFTRFIDDEEIPEFRKMLQTGFNQKIRGEIKGKNIHFRLTMSPLPSNFEGDICIVVSDITEIRKYQESLQGMVKERSSKLKIANKQLTEDLVKLKKAGKDLRESEKKFKQLANSIPQLAWVAHPDGSRIWFNQRWFDYTGKTFEQAKGMGWHAVHDPVILPSVINRWNKSVSLGKPFEMVIPLLGKDGIFREFLTSSMPMKDNKGRIVQWFGTNTDISKLRKIEKELENNRQKLSIALQTGNIGTWEWFLKSNKIVFDDRMQAIFGVRNDYNITYSTLENFINEEDLPHFRKAVSFTLKYGVPFETVFRTNQNGSDSKYLTTKALLNKDKNGKPLSLSGVCFDVTSMKKDTEQILMNLNEELLKSNRDLQQFAYVASHDLQEPLRMVSSFTQLLLHRYEDKLDADGREFIKYAVDGCKRMYDLLNALLAYSRVQTSGKEFTKVKLNDVLEKVLQNLSLRIEERKAKIKSKMLPFVYADEAQMIQLIQNLIENSIKFSEETPKIVISSKSNIQEYIISVKDEGLGIDPKYNDRIFKIFQRLVPREKYEGTGIGLAICKRIVERHGGRIWLESEAGKGSTFFFSIPR